MTEQSEVQKPVGPFEDFDACVRHFEGDPDVDDPQALCGWMEENKDLAQEYDPQDGGILEFVEELKDPDAEKVLTNLEVTYVSGVGDPAIDSQWVYAKDAADEGADWGVTSPIVLHTSKTVAVDGGGRAPVWSTASDDTTEKEEEQKAWAPVLIPNETDKQGDVIPSDEIESAAHEFLAKYRQIDTDHDLFDGKGTPIESWTLKDSQTFTLPDGSESREYPAGTWMMGVQFSDEAWDRVKAGELTGFSIYGEATQIAVEDFLSGNIEPAKAEGASPSTRAALAAKGVTGTSTENNNMSEDNDPEKGLTKNFDEEQAQYLGMTIESFIASTGGSLDSSLSDYLTWAGEEGVIPSSITVAGQEFGGGGGGDSEETEEPETPEEDGGGMEDEQEMSNKNEGGEEPSESEEQTSEGADPELKEMVSSVKDTVESTQKSVSDVQDRVDELEKEVFGGEDDNEEPDPTPSEDLDEAVEQKMADILGVEKSDLPDDPDERNEAIRKHIHESRTPGDDSPVDPDAWDDDDFAALTEGN